jgi:hypothetical protein
MVLCRTKGSQSTGQGGLGEEAGVPLAKEDTLNKLPSPDLLLITSQMCPSDCQGVCTFQELLLGSNPSVETAALPPPGSLTGLNLPHKQLW